MRDKPPSYHRDRDAKMIGGALVGAWLTAWVLSLGLIGVIVWAIIKVVNHFT